MISRAKILVVVECQADAKLLTERIQKHLPKTMTYRCVDQFSQAIDHLIHNQADLIVMAPNSASQTAMDQVHQLHRLAPEALVILITGSGTKEPWVEAIEEWALEFISKGHLDNDAEFTRTLLHLLERHRLFTTLERQAQIIEHRERQTRSILETIRDAILIVAPDGIIQYANRASAALFHRDVETLVGTSFDHLVAPQDATEITIVRPDKSQAIVQIHTHATVWNHGPATLITLHDITGIKQHEASLERLNTELTQKNREMEQFVFVATHDLKSPLVHMSIFAENIKEDSQAGRLTHLTEYAERIDSAATRMRRTIDDLLELSRIGRFLGTAAEVDVEQMVQDLVREQYEARFLAEGVTFELQGPMPTILADPTRMWQLFSNLLSNAMKHGMEGSTRRIQVGSQITRREVRYFVKDFGPGIAPIYHQRIFNLFQRITADKEGTGIGLAIVKRIAEVHGGRVWVKSSPGRGATFWVAFPRRLVMDQKSCEALSATT